MKQLLHKIFIKYDNFIISGVLHIGLIILLSLQQNINIILPSSSNVTVGVIQLDNFNNQSNQNINNDNNKIIAKIAPATDALADNNTIIDTKSEPDDILLKKTNVEKNSENTNTNIKQNKTDNTSNNETTAKQLTQSQLNNTKPKDQKLDSKKRLDTKTNIVPKTKKSNLQIDDMIDIASAAPNLSTSALERLQASIPDQKIQQLSESEQQDIYNKYKVGPAQTPKQYLKDTDKILVPNYAPAADNASSKVVRPGKPQPYRDPRTPYRPSNPLNTPRGPNTRLVVQTTRTKDGRVITTARTYDTSLDRRTRNAEWRHRNRYRDNDSRNVNIVLPALSGLAGYAAGQTYDSSSYNEPLYVGTSSYVPEDTYDTYTVPTPSRTYIYGSWEGRSWGPLTIGSKYRGNVVQNDLFESEYDSCWYDSQDRLLCRLDNAWYTAS